MHADFVFAIVLSALASLATVAGGMISLVVRRPGPKVMAVSLGFSAGVMVFVSFAELLPSGIAEVGFLPAVGAFFGGLVLMFLIDAAVPHVFVTEGHELKIHPDCLPAKPEAGQPADKLMRASLLIAIGIGIHNLPEGMATFAGALKNRGLGLAIGSAVALHNIPEGLAVAVPVFCATGSRRRSILWAFLSGVSELVGALLAAAVLMPFLTPQLLAITLAAVAGLMVFISFDELIPGSYSYGHEHSSVIGLVAGMALMAFGIWILQ
ncbi:MAG: zinc transporter ZupT [bacterium]